MQTLRTKVTALVATFGFTLGAAVAVNGLPAQADYVRHPGTACTPEDPYVDYSNPLSNTGTWLQNDDANAIDFTCSIPSETNFLLSQLDSITVEAHDGNDNSGGSIVVRACSFDGLGNVEGTDIQCTLDSYADSDGDLGIGDPPIHSGHASLSIPVDEAFESPVGSIGYIYGSLPGVDGSSASYVTGVYFVY